MTRRLKRSGASAATVGPLGARVATQVTHTPGSVEDIIDRIQRCKQEFTIYDMASGNQRLYRCTEQPNGKRLDIAVYRPTRFSHDGVMVIMREAWLHCGEIHCDGLKWGKFTPFGFDDTYFDMLWSALCRGLKPEAIGLCVTFHAWPR